MATSEEALAILSGLAGYVSARTISRSRAANFSSIGHWLSAPRSPPDGDTHRMRAFVLGYFAISGGRIDPTGIQLDDGLFLKPDKGVMKWALRRRILGWRESSPPFVYLTETGRQFFTLGIPLPPDQDHPEVSSSIAPPFS